MTRRRISMSPERSGKSATSTSKRSSVTISGRLPQGALAKETRSIASVGVNDGWTRIWPAISRSRPVAFFASASIRGRR
jgi:hypothetical protein